MTKWFSTLSSITVDCIDSAVIGSKYFLNNIKQLIKIPTEDVAYPIFKGLRIGNFTGFQPFWANWAILLFIVVLFHLFVVELLIFYQKEYL